DGTDQTMQGGLDYQNVFVRGTAAFGGDASLSSSLVAVFTGIIDIGGNTVDVAGSLETGRLTMQDDAGLLRVAGDVTFGGRDTNGLLTAGTIEVAGDFVQRQGQSGCCNSFPRTFQASGTHTVILNGTGAQLIDFNSGGLAADRSRFNRLIIDNAGGVTLA